MNYRISDVKQAWLSDGIPYSDMDLPPEVKFSSTNLLEPFAKNDMLYIDNGVERLELMEVKHGFGFAPVIRLYEIFHGKLSGDTVTIPFTQKAADELLQDKQTLEKYIASQARRLKEININQRRRLIEQNI